MRPSTAVMTLLSMDQRTDMPIFHLYKKIQEAIPTLYKAKLHRHKMLQEELVEILLGYFRVQAVYLQEQSILAMYSYSAVSGIVVDVGDHIDVIPVVEGCIIESGATRLPYGGRQVTDTLARHLTEKGHRFFSEVETYVARLIKEQACYVSEQRVTDGTDEIHSTDVNLAKYIFLMDHFLSRIAGISGVCDTPSLVIVRTSAHTPGAARSS
ncbi:predicted protein [Nematostella vectensis]|uniref:Actin-related protein 8 n=1 Tax=Nematostella vectensis TaxID=45351 RepID=A7RTR6_NEMVE|nr:predicted protein [Nematostella vectensis]|eukprot:XP_001637139.1 predicted protein [Nematostella vectensis]